MFLLCRFVTCFALCSCGTELSLGVVIVRRDEEKDFVEQHGVCVFLGSPLSESDNLFVDRFFC